MQGRPITIPIVLDGGSLNVTYRLILPEKSNEPDEPEKLLESIVKYVDSWDLLDDDDTPIPITTETLGEVPVVSEPGREVARRRVCW